jgi:hypothetical protein
MVSPMPNQSSEPMPIALFTGAAAKPPGLGDAKWSGQSTASASCW